MRLECPCQAATTAGIPAARIRDTDECRRLRRVIAVSPAAALFGEQSGVVPHPGVKQSPRTRGNKIVELDGRPAPSRLKGRS